MTQEIDAYNPRYSSSDRLGIDAIIPSTVLPFNRNILISEDGRHIIKIRPDDADTQTVLKYFDCLASIGMELGTRPEFTQSPGGEVIEISDFIPASSDAYYLHGAPDCEAIRYYRETILCAITKVVEASPTKDTQLLDLSIDPTPHNFVTGRYIDYDPVVLEADDTPSRRLDPKQLWNYALVKTARLRPELFDTLYEQTITYLSENGFLDSWEYLSARPYEEVRHIIERTIHTAPNSGFIDITNIVFAIDPYTHGDDLIGLLCLFTNRMTPEQLKRTAAVLGIEASDFLGRAIVEEVSYSNKQNPTHFRKKVLEVASLFFKTDQYKDFDLEGYAQKLNNIEDMVRESAKELRIKGTILNIGSLVRGKISAFSDLDYAYFSKGNSSDIISLIESLGGILTAQEIARIDNLSNGVVEETKVKLDIQDVKVSILVIGAGVEEIIASGKPRTLRGYPNSSRIAKDLGGNVHTIRLSETEPDFTWRQASDAEIMGPLIENVLMSWVTYENDFEGELLIVNTYKLVAEKVIRHTGLSSPSFNYLLRTLYNDHERYFTGSAFDYFRNRWETAIANNSALSIAMRKVEEE